MRIFCSLKPCPRQRPQSQHRAVARGGCLVVGHVGRRPRHRSGIGHTDVLGVSAAPVAAQAEHRVALGERPDLRADRFDLAGELAAQNRVPGSSEPGEQPNEDGVGLPHAAVRAVDGRGVDLDE